MTEGKDTQEKEQEGTPIKVGIGLGGLLDQLTNLAESVGDTDAQARVAELKRRLGGLSLGDLSVGEGGAVGIGSIFSIVGKIAEMAQNLQTAVGKGGVQEFSIGGKKGVISFGGNIGSLSDLVSGKEDTGSDFKPEPVVPQASQASRETTTVAPPDERQSGRFNLEVTEAGETVLVFGTVPAVEDESAISCEVIEGGTQLMIVIKGYAHTVELPSPVSPGQAEANYTNGLFSVTLQKV